MQPGRTVLEVSGLARSQDKFGQKGRDPQKDQFECQYQSVGCGCKDHVLRPHLELLRRV